MPIDPATGEEEEDLSTIEWGAGLSRLIDGQLPNMIFFGVGWSLLGAISTHLCSLLTSLLTSLFLTYAQF